MVIKTGIKNKIEKKTIKNNPFLYLFKKKDNNDDENDDADSQPLLDNKKEDKRVFIKANHIYFNDDVSKESVQALIDIIDNIILKNKKIEFENSLNGIKMQFPEYYLHINTAGGDLHAGFLAYDKIKNCELTINTVSEGYTISAGTIMYMAGNMRYMRENSMFLIHQLSTYLSGYMTYAGLTDNKICSKLLMDKIKKIYIDNARNNILTVRKLNRILSRDRFWDVAKCIEYGLVDEIYYN